MAFGAHGLEDRQKKQPPPDAGSCKLSCPGPSACAAVLGKGPGALGTPLSKGQRPPLELQLFAAEQGQDKTEEPTPHRLREARKRGQVLKSMEFNSAINMLGMVFFFVIFWRYFLSGFTDMMRYYLRDLPGLAVDVDAMDYIAQFSLEQYVTLAAPFLLAALVIGIASNLVQVGFLVTAEPLKPQAKRINPIEGAKKIFSRRALFEMAKAVLKITIIGAVCYFYLRGEIEPLLLLLGQEMGVVTSVMGRVLQGLGFRVAAVFLFLAVIDFIYQRYEHKKNLKMTRREVKEEHKHLEGDPHLRARLRQRQREISQQRSLEEVPDSTVVVTNPTELAIALRYNEGEDAAPVLVAKGAGKLAQRIRELARENDIPLIQNPPVARMLFEQVDLGQEIPPELYQAVAEILAVVYRLQERRTPRRSA